MTFRSFSALALTWLLATQSDAYMVGWSGIRFSTVPAVGQQRQLFPPPMRRPDVRSVAASAPMAAATQGKNAAQRMLDFYCSMVWIARPDLFLYDRLARMAWDNVSKNLKKLESDNAPENVLNKALMEMRNDLAKVKDAYEDVIDTQRRMFIQKQQAEDAAEELYRYAQYELTGGDEKRARETLLRRHELLEGAKQLQADIEAQDVTREKLYEAFQTLETKFRDSVAKRDDLLARAKTAESMAKINEMLNEFNAKRSSGDAFDNFEKKVEALEATAEAFSPFDWLQSKVAPMTDDERLEREFASLKDSAAVEKELEMMRDQWAGRFDRSRSSDRAAEKWF